MPGSAKSQLPIDEIIARVASGDRRAGARLLSRIERAEDEIIPALKSLFLKGGKTRLIGITGPPGAGKSTLINALIREARKQNQTVAVLAVDPSSPFSGGAILGDRVRMNQHASDPGVLIRSMATRGHLGGLSRATGDSITVLDAMGFDTIIIETVGVGQSEVEIVRHADTVLLVQPPNAGDGIQSVKSGIMEVADIFVVNKAELPGSKEAVRNIREAVTLHYHDASWQPPVIETQANSGEGIKELLERMAEHGAFLAGNGGEARLSRLEKAKYRIAEISEQLVRRRVFDERQWSQAFIEDVEKVCSRELDPYSLSERLLSLNEDRSG